MNIADAQLGDVLLDNDGAKWIRTRKMARCIFDPTNSDDDGDDAGENVAVGRADLLFGPFTRLVPEPQAAEVVSGG